MRSAMQHFQLMQIHMHVRWLHCASQCTDGTKLMGRTQSQTGRNLDFAPWLGDWW
jgi:hypothetical protein